MISTREVLTRMKKLAQSPRPISLVHLASSCMVEASELPVRVCAWKMRNEVSYETRCRDNRSHGSFSVLVHGALGLHHIRILSAKGLI